MNLLKSRLNMLWEILDWQLDHVCVMYGRTICFVQKNTHNNNFVSLNFLIATDIQGMTCKSKHVASNIPSAQPSMESRIYFEKN